MPCLRLWGCYEFHIEEGFLDDQSSGWNLQRSEIRSVTDLSRLWFSLAVATLYVTAQGLEVVQSGRRRWIDTHCWMVFALIQTGSVSLTKWTTYLPCRGFYAQSKQRRVRRWLGNSRINIHRLYKPLIRAALATWKAECLYLCLDTSLFWEEYCLIRLAVVYRGRSIPLAWRVLEHASASVSCDTYQALLKQSAQYLPSGVAVILLADRGFVHTRAMKTMRQLGWHYRIRIKSDTWLWRPGSGWCQPNSFHLARGKALCFHNVRLHRQEKYGPVHVILGRNNINGEFWAVLSDQPTSPETFAEYGLRFDIEMCHSQCPHSHATWPAKTA